MHIHNVLNQQCDPILARDSEDIRLTPSRFCLTRVIGFCPISSHLLKLLKSSALSFGEGQHFSGYRPWPRIKRIASRGSCLPAIPEGCFSCRFSSTPVSRRKLDSTPCCFV